MIIPQEAADISARLHKVLGQTMDDVAVARTLAGQPGYKRDDVYALGGLANCLINLANVRPTDKAMLRVAQLALDAARTRAAPYWSW